MRRLFVVLAVMLVSTTLLAQRRQVRIPISDGAPAAEGAVKQSVERLSVEKKALDRDLAVLAHIRAGERALTDPIARHWTRNGMFRRLAELRRRVRSSRRTRVVVVGHVSRPRQTCSRTRGSARA